nr:pyridoxal phosphate-dependent aminotransferase [Granulosicoccus sp.]
MSNLYSDLCRRLDDTGDGAAWAVHDRALEMQRAGDDVVVLSIGDPDFRTPDPIIDNAVSHMRVGRTHYSPALGELNLRRAVADYESRVSTHPCSSDEVAIFPGVTAAIYAVLSCLLNAGDQIVVVDPQYVGYAPIFRALDADVVIADANSDNGFVPQFDAIIETITDTTKVVLLNTPGNPTGAIIDRQTLADLAEYCQANNIWLVCDEVYSMFTFDDPHVSLRTAAKSLSRLVVIDGLSKSHAMSGWRMGWVVAPRELVHHLGNFAAMSLFGCPQFIQD